MSTTKINQFMNNLNNVEDTSAAVPFTVAEATATHKLTILNTRARNFRSIGDNFMEMDFTANQSTLVVSDDNGAGKSTLCVWAVYYAITGKPYGDKEKVTSLVNTTNRNKMVVEMEFLKGGNHYKVIRGRKPDIFEIHLKVDGEFKLIDDDAAKKDWQGYLWGLLGLEKETGTKIIENVIILGKDKFKPFIEMGAEDRRKMVEPIWDLGIFSDLNEQLKADRKATATELDDAHIEFREVEHKVDLKAAAIEMAKVTAQGNTSLHTNNVNISKRDVDEAETTFEAAERSLEGVEESLTGFKVECDERVVNIETRLQKHVDGIDGRISEAVAAVSGDVQAKEELRTNNATQHQTNIQGIVDRRKSNEAQQQEVIEALETEIEDQQSVVDALVTNLETATAGGTEDIETNINEINTKMSELNTKVVGMNGHHVRFSTALEGIETDLKALDELGDCPTCRQHVSDAYKGTIAEQMQPKIDEHKSNIDKADKALEGFSEQLTQLQVDLEKANKDLSAKRNETQQISNDLSTAKVELKNLQNRLGLAGDVLERIKSDSRDEYAREEKRFTDTNTEIDLALAELDGKVTSIGGDRRAILDVETLEIQKELSLAKEVYSRKVEEERFKANESIGYWQEQLDSRRAALAEAEKELEAVKAKDEEAVEALNKELEVLQGMVDAIGEKVNDLTKDLEDWDALKLLLSDKEGKADIIRRYVPYLNHKINEYLEAMNMFIGFELDESFNAKMTAPDRANQTLFSLSSGQRARVNLAIVFALRDVANMKASVQTNLLVMDEVLENMSERGVLEATTMIKEKFGSSNLLVVTQREQEFSEHFHNSIKYGLRDGYTTVLKGD